MIFCGSRTTSATIFRNLHTRANRPQCQLIELWERATGPLVGCAKWYMMRLTWRGAGALDEAAARRPGSVDEAVDDLAGPSRLPNHAS